MLYTDYITRANLEVGTIIVALRQMKILRLKNIKELVQGHTDS